MGLNLGIIGLPQVGKKTIFGLLTEVESGRASTRAGIAYGAAAVRDPRVDRLTAMFKPKRSRYADFEIALPPDIKPDTARTADWLEPLRRVDALLHVIRAFSAPDVFHLCGSVDPVRDLDLVETELLFADLELVETRLGRIAKERQPRNAVAAAREQALLERCRAHLEAERPLRDSDLSEDDHKQIRSLQFLTMKPLVVVINGDDAYAAGAALPAPLQARLAATSATVVMLSAKLESELREFEPEEGAAFMQELGIAEPAAHRLSRAAYECLGLISFFTVGDDEVRGWPVRAGALAPEAAGKIHSDLERGFIRAERIDCAALLAAGSERDARQQHLYQVHGKDYEVQDGDVLHIRFNV